MYLVDKVSWDVSGLGSHHTIHCYLTLYTPAMSILTTALCDVMSAFVAVIVGSLLWADFPVPPQWLAGKWQGF